MTEIEKQIDNDLSPLASVPNENAMDFKCFPYEDQAHGISITLNESQVHGRKMLRRVANRRSAQQSRARKKVSLAFDLSPFRHKSSLMSSFS